ncbi:hypothetical protein NEOLEDRAFT_931760 [Neolentinus lepideus HHB14362 ss-1]|uniref:G-protein coupled receptors family 1 profile domain-containing protein n=1 Tax=Neolentinus lepideus HHB14362 ss-1 TaxID=1314782 RepID=A0A165NJT8_9AGAM|nr:hypothetical protein NEOLEDRAFT_931760 [Neolentinus lepideus HHB14362 ss-1]
MAVLSLQRSGVLWLSVITVLYGCHMTLYVAASYILSSRWRLSSTQRVLFILITILFMMSTAAAVIAFTAVFVLADSDVLSGDKGYPGETESVLHEKELDDLLECVIDVITNIVNVIADGLVIWRCYILCRRRFAILIMSYLLLVTGTVFGCITLILDIRIYKIRKDAPLSELLPPHAFLWDSNVANYSDVGFWTASALTNILAIVFMGFQIRRVCAERKRIHAAPNSKVILVLNLIIESGMIYLASIVIIIIATGVSSSPNVHLARIMPCITAGISPTFLAVFLALGNSKRNQNTRTTIHADKLSNWQVARPPGYSLSFSRIDEGMTLSVYVTAMDEDGDGDGRLIQEVCRERCA